MDAVASTSSFSDSNPGDVGEAHVRHVPCWQDPEVVRVVLENLARCMEREAENGKALKGPLLFEPVCELIWEDLEDDWTTAPEEPDDHGNGDSGVDENGGRRAVEVAFRLMQKALRVYAFLWLDPHVFRCAGDFVPPGDRSVLSCDGTWGCKTPQTWGDLERWIESLEVVPLTRGKWILSEGMVVDVLCHHHYLMREWRKTLVSDAL